MELDWIPENAYSISPTSFAIGLLTLIGTIVYYYVHNKNLPPGPIGLPLLGYWPFLNDKDCCLQLERLKRKYGDFYSFTSTGGRLFISLGSFKMVREAHLANSDSFGGRFEDFNLLTAVFADGVGFMNGDGWRSLRKFLLNSFKERGILSMRDNVSLSMQEAIASTVQDLKGMGGQPVNILQLLTDKCTSILRMTLFGEEGVSEDRIREINELYGAVMEYMTATNLLLTGNIAKYIILPMSSGYSKYKKSHELIETLLFKIVDEHKATYDEENLRDIIDEYIKERNERQRKGDPTAKYFTDRALVVTLVQIVGDGVLSVAAFIALYVKMLLDHPDEQDTMYEEIAEMVGLDRLPTVADKSKLKYTNAFIMEGLRTSNFFPFFPSMQCTKETTLRGYRIPIGTITLLNTWSAHNDEEEYEEPERFNPSRFLEDEEGRRRRPELPITFGVGKRACVGEAFAMIQVFLFMTSLIQNFHIRPLNDNEEATIELLFSGKLQILVEPRNTET